MHSNFYLTGYLIMKRCINSFEFLAKFKSLVELLLSEKQDDVLPVIYT